MAGEWVGLLVLTRKPKQSIMIGDHIEVTVLSTAGDKVRLGIQAPADVPVRRWHHCIRDAVEFLDIAPKARVKTTTTRYPLNAANEALADLRDGRLRGAAVLQP